MTDGVVHHLGDDLLADGRAVRDREVLAEAEEEGDGARAVLLELRRDERVGRVAPVVDDRGARAVEAARDVEADGDLDVDWEAKVQIVVSVQIIRNLPAPAFQ